MKKSFNDLFIGNIGVIFFIGLLVFWLSPYNIEHGYKLNWDIIGLLIFTLIYYIYCWLYPIHRVRGTFIISK